MSLSGFRQTVLGVVMCTALTAQAAAASTIAVGVTNTTGSQLVSDISFTLGWSFTALNDIVVTDLGLFDDSMDGLGESHEIGLWSSSGTLLVSTTLASGTSGMLVGNFRFAPVGLTTLLSGQTYRIGALFPASNPNQDPLVFVGDATGFSPSADVLFLQSQEIAGPTLTDPTNSFSAEPGYFGPNFRYGPAPTTVPEPATLSLLGMGLALTARAFRRRRLEAR